MENKTIHESLQEYLKNTPKEKVLEDWNEFQHLDNEGITVKEFLENQKQETLEEFSRRRFNEQKLDTYTSYNIEDAIKEGAKWQQEQDEKLYNEEDLREAFRQGEQNINYSEIYGLDSKLTEQEWFEKLKKK